MGIKGWLGFCIALVQPLAALATPGYDIIIIAGQSNAAGWGRADGSAWIYTYLDDADYLAYSSRVFQLGRFNADDHQVIPAAHTLQNWNMSGQEPYIGFGLTFARRYAASYSTSDRKVLIIPAAYAGTSIVMWNGKIDLPSTLNTLEAQHDLYQDLKERLTFALGLTYGNSVASDNRIAAVLWGHGENNIYGVAFNDQDDFPGTHSTVADERVYYYRLKELFQKLRSDFPTPDNFPILLNEVPQDWEVPYPYNGNTGLLAYVGTNGLNAKRRITYVQTRMESRMPKVGFVSSADLASDPENNGIHFSAQSQIFLGERYFAKLQQVLLQGNPDSYPYLRAKLAPYLSSAQLNSYVNLVANGKSCGAAYELLLNSNPNFAGALNAGTENDFITFSFQFLLDRMPEAQERSDWKQILLAKGGMRISTFLSMLALPELQIVCGANNAE